MARAGREPLRTLFTVFMISWKNPDAEDRELRMEDYRTLGVMAALDAIGAIVPDRKVHAAGYCIGGTLLAIAAAAMARDGDERLRSMTFLAAQTDFTEAGELMLFIDESQLAFLEDLMWQQGFLDTTQMAGAFRMLRSADLVWSRIVRDYLMGVLLTTGGHNVGIVSEPGRPDRSYQVMTKRHGDAYVDPETWLARAPQKKGSWWPECVVWLHVHSGALVAPPPTGMTDRPVLFDAPGRYVLAP